MEQDPKSKLVYVSGSIEGTHLDWYSSDGDQVVKKIFTENATAERVHFSIAPKKKFKLLICIS